MPLWPVQMGLALLVPDPHVHMVRLAKSGTQRMLNAELVENFHSIYRQKKTGSLSVASDTANMRFLFQEGEVMAMDLGEDKEHLLADKLLEYHRLDAAQHALVFATREKVQGTVSEIVRNLHLASDAEVSQSTRAMVEDALCAIFSSDVRHLNFQPGHGIETFNFERSAVRLRIAVEILLTTVDKRVAEIQDVKRAVPTWDVIFAFAESEDAGELTDFEKHVLNFVDGHRTVEEIASACRDSSLNLARALNGLAKKGIVRRVGTPAPKPAKAPTGQSREATPQRSPTLTPRPASEPAPEAAQAQAPAPVTHLVSRAETVSTAPETANQPVVFESTRPGMSRTILVVAGLAAVAVGGYLVWTDQQVKADINTIQGEIQAKAEACQWAEAQELLTNLQNNIANDHPKYLRRLEPVQEAFQTALVKEAATISTLIKNENFDEAGRRIALLPPVQAQSDLNDALATAQKAFLARANQFASDISAALDNSDAATVNRLLTTQTNARIAAQGREVLSSWRKVHIEEAASPGTDIDDRLQLVKVIRAAQPTDAPLAADQVEMLNRIESQIHAAELELRKQLEQLQALADKGDVDQAMAKADKLGIPVAVHGDAELAKSYAAFVKTCTQIRDGLKAFHADALAAISSGKPADTLTAAVTAGEHLLRTYPDAAGHDQEEAFLGHLQEVLDALSLPLEQQDTALTQLCDSIKSDPQLVDAVKARVKLQTASETEATMLLKSGQRNLADHNFHQAERAFQRIIGDKDWANTNARKYALDALAQTKKQQDQIQTGKADLDAAIAEGNYDKAIEIVRAIGLPYMPLVIDSRPAGAQVWQSGHLLGVTPVVLDVTAADRIDYAVEVRAPGYLPKSVVGSAAEGGWHLHVQLERQAVAQADLGQSVTSHPLTVDGKVWVANHACAFAISASGTVENTPYTFAHQASPLNEPVYAPICMIGKGLYVPTRERVAVRIAADGGRSPLGGPTDFALACFESPELLDARFLIVAGTDAMVHAVVESTPSQHWDSAAGAAFACAPSVVGESVFTLRQDGTLEAWRAYDGKPLTQDHLTGKIISAWPTPTGLSGDTADVAWSWDGQSITTTPLPAGIVAGGPEALVSSGGRAFVRAKADWREVGHLDGTPTGDPIAWDGNVVVPTGSSMQVVGPLGFTVAGAADMLAPVVVDERLMVIAQDGKVKIFAPSPSLAH